MGRGMKQQISSTTGQHLPPVNQHNKMQMDAAAAWAMHVTLGSQLAVPSR
jgi:hypothetical protein